jgi:hypothetical protein
MVPETKNPRAAAPAAPSRAADDLVPTKPSRGLMYALVSLQGLPNWVIRGVDVN